MPKTLTDGTYTLAETEKKDQLVFFRNDHGVLRNIGTSHLELYSKYLIKKSRTGEIQQSVYTNEISFEISEDGKLIRLTVSDDLEKNPNLRLVEARKKESPSAATKHRMNFFKSIKRKLFGKG